MIWSTRYCRSNQGYYWALWCKYHLEKVSTVKLKILALHVLKIETYMMGFSYQYDSSCFIYAISPNNTDTKINSAANWLIKSSKWCNLSIGSAIYCDYMILHCLHRFKIKIAFRELNQMMKIDYILCCFSDLNYETSV